MSSDPHTPKKVYGGSNIANRSCCRLCKSVGDPAHRSKLFSKANVTLLALTEQLYGHHLPNKKELPQLICRPCERRLRNLNAFKTTISETQLLWTRVKRCNKDSPSASRTLKSLKAIDQAGIPCQRLTYGHSLMEKENKRSEALETETIMSEEIAAKNQETTFESDEESENQMGKLISKIEKELLDIARREKKSVLRERGYPGLSSLNFEEIIQEMMSRCPTVFLVLSHMVPINLNRQKNIASLVLLYSIIMFRICHELSRIQRVNTVLLTEGNATRELLERLSMYGVCLGKSMKYSIQGEIGNHFLDQAVHLVKEGVKFVVVLDNIDWEVKAHDMRSDKQNTSVHAVATSIVFDRVNSDQLSDENPNNNLENIDLKDLLNETDEETRSKRERYKIFLGRILYSSFASFNFFKAIVPDHTPCRYQVEMASQSIVVPLPVLMKDEKKYAELVDILDQLEAWVHDIYSKAGLCDPPSQDCIPTPPPPIGISSRPDQPSAHVAPVAQPDDPLVNVKIPCFGDQLTRVRLAGAKDLRAGSHTPQDRFDHIYPIKIVDWHTKRSFLKVIFKKLYKNSAREQGTLRYFREKLQRRNVTVDVKHFEDCEQFFLGLGKCFTIEALVEFFGMETKDDRPNKNKPPPNTVNVGDNLEEYYHTVLDKFIDQFLLTKITEDASADQDAIRKYSLCLMRYFFIFYDIKDAVKEGNGERLATLHKQLLQHFMSSPGFNAYAIEMLISVIQNEVLLSQAQLHQCIWASTANWKGGPGKNIEIDLLQENRNKDLKKLVKGMGANKTDKAIDNASRAVGGERKIIENFDYMVDRTVRSSSHSHASSLTDEGKVLSDLRILRPFTIKPNRKHESFPDMMSNPLATLDDEKFDKWLKKHKKNLMFDAPIELDEEEL